MRKLTLVFLCFMSGIFSTEPSYILCIDGGGSKTILQVLDAQGEVVTLTKNNSKADKIEAAGSNINAVGKQGVKDVFHALFEGVRIGDSNLIDILPNCQVVAGMAGIGLAENKQNVFALFEECGIKAERILLMSDAELALKLIDDRGIILISGTGSICFAKKDALYRVGGLGKILGDEGSGYQIGLQALKMALAEEYGWGAPTSLTPVLKKFFNVSELKTLISKITLGEIPHSKIGSCTPLVFEEAWNGDEIAGKIIDRAANDLADMLVTQLKISNLSDCEVHLWGGVFKNLHTDAFIQKIMKVVDPHGNKKLRILNKSSDNAAVQYVKMHRV